MVMWSEIHSVVESLFLIIESQNFMQIRLLTLTKDFYLWSSDQILSQYNIFLKKKQVYSDSWISVKLLMCFAW